jgi:5-methylcytosine-specific restriction endonuclease McrA
VGISGVQVSRRSFSAKVEDEAEARAQGKCEDCGGQLKPGKFQYDHIKPHGLGGESTLENCRVRCVVCHLAKTMDADMPPMRRADKQAKIKKQLPVAAGDSEISRRFGVKQ